MPISINFHAGHAHGGGGSVVSLNPNTQKVPQKVPHEWQKEMEKEKDHSQSDLYNMTSMLAQLSFIKFYSSAERQHKIQKYNSTKQQQKQHGRQNIRHYMV